MSPRFRVSVMVLVVFLGALLAAPQADAATPVAKISSFNGEVILVSGSDLIKVTQVGLGVNEGDTLQTKEGEAEIAFDDGAVMKVRRHTTTMIQQREETTGWWIFKGKEWARRVTCQVGTFWFKSGASQTKNYLQTPTAVCGLRGSIAEFGYNNVMSYVNQIEGSAELKGQIQAVTREFFQNLQANAQQFASQNAVYTKLTDAYNKTEQAKVTEAPLTKAEAKVATLDATKAAVQAIMQNPELSAEAKSVLAAVIVKVNNDLNTATQQLEDVKKTTTTVAQPTSTVAEVTTSVAATTTTVAEMTTLPPTTLPPPTFPPTTVTIPITTTTTTTSVGSPR